MLRQDPFDLGRVDVLAAADDHVLDAVGDVDVAVGIHVAAIAGAQPAVLGDRRGGRLRLAPVAAHQLFAADPDLARDTGRDRLAGAGFAHADLDPRDRLARRDQPMGHRRVLVVGGEQHAHHAALLGHAVDLLQPAGKELQRRAHHRQGHRRGAVGERLQRRVVARRGTRNLGHHRHQRRHQEGVGDALPLEHLEHRGRVGQAQHHDARAHADRGQRVAGAADVEQRHRHLHDGVDVDLRVGRAVARMGQHAAVGEQRALGEAGGARGVELHEAVVRRDLVRARLRRLGGQPGLVFVVGSADADHPLDARQLVAQLRDRRRELRADEEDARLRVVDDVRDLRRREPEVDHRVGGAHQCAGQRQLDAGRMVEVEHRDAVAGLQARGTLGRRIAPHPLGELRPAAVDAVEADRDRIGPLGLPAGEDVGEVLRLGHARSWWFGGERPRGAHASHRCGVSASWHTRCRRRLRRRSRGSSPPAAAVRHPAPPG